MTRSAQAVRTDALRLDLRSRTELAAEFPESTAAPSDRDAEIRSRVSAIEAGTENLEPWKEVRRRTEREIRNR